MSTDSLINSSLRPTHWGQLEDVPHHVQECWVRTTRADIWEPAYRGETCWVRHCETHYREWTTPVTSGEAAWNE